MAELKNPVAVKPNPTQFSSAVTIDILVVIDTDAIINSSLDPGQNPDEPTPIDHNNQFMFCNDPRKFPDNTGPKGQGTGDLNFPAAPNDIVCFRGTSVYNNSDDAVLIYDIVKYGGDDVMNNQFVPVSVTRTGAAVPQTGPGTGNGLPAQLQKLTFYGMQTTVSAAGKENFKIRFAIYRLDDSGEKQQLYGYYEWDPSITVS